MQTGLWRRRRIRDEEANPGDLALRPLAAWGEDLFEELHELPRLVVHPACGSRRGLSVGGLGGR